MSALRSDSLRMAFFYNFLARANPKAKETLRILQKS